MKKHSSFFLFALVSSMLLCSCNKKPSNDVPEPFIPSPDGPFTSCEIYPVDFGVNKTLASKDEITEYMAGVVNDNRPVEDGVILSPYFSKMTINEVEVPIYATRTTNTTHSFAYVDIKKEDINLSTKLDVVIEASTLKKSFRTVEVLPLKNNIIASIENKTIKATIYGEGNYSFVFDKKQGEALTLFVAPKDDKSNYLVDGDIQRTITEIEPGNYYGDNNLQLINQNSVYFFKKGMYQIGSIIIPEKSILYFEEGCYLTLYPDSQIPIYSGSTTHTSICLMKW